MKNKTKVVLGLAAVLAGTVGVAGVSTFAWFTTQNTASISFADAHVVSDNASILIQYEPIANNGLEGKVTSGLDAAGSNVSIAGASIECRDISGDGRNFYRPHWSTFPTTADGMTDITVANFTASKTYYVTFGITLTNKGEADTKVFLGLGSLLAPKITGNTEDEQAVTATRVAIYDGASSGIATQALVSTWQFSNVGKGVGYKYLQHDGTTSSNSAYGQAGYNLSAPQNVFEGAGATCTYDTTTTGTLLHHFDSESARTTHLTISMWIEGTLTTADDNCIGGDVSMTLNLEAYQNGN